MQLVADSGSTKTTWCCFQQSGEKFYFETEGYNPCHVSSEYMLHSLGNTFPASINRESVERVYFYGAGCYEENCSRVPNTLLQLFPNSSPFVELDLLGAARALLGNKPGFAAILGTGTNTCLYNGSSITANIDSLGYILGDEGSGAAIGKKLLAAYVRDYLPADLKGRFLNRFGLTPFKVIDRIYSQPLAARFCASFCPFVSDNIQHEYLHALVKECFCELFQNLVCRYTAFTQYRFNSVGSIGFAFQSILEEVASEFTMPVGNILKSPIEGLVDYHQNISLDEKLNSTIIQQ